MSHGGVGEKEKAQSKGTRVVIQQCTSAKLKFDISEDIVEIGRGMVIFVAFFKEADTSHVKKIVDGVFHAKICEDENDVRKTLTQVLQYDLLLVPQATLGGKLKGKSLQYHDLEDKTRGSALFDELAIALQVSLDRAKLSGSVKRGIYGARQILSLDTNGPFTHVLDFQ